jgi:hypothetical protein
LFDIASNKLEQWEKNHWNKKTYQLVYNRKAEVTAKVKVTHIKKKVHTHFGDKRRKMPQVSTNGGIVATFKLMLLTQLL